MENFKNEFYNPENQAEYNGYDDELVDTIDSEYAEFDDFDDDDDDDSADYENTDNLLEFDDDFGDDDDDDSFGETDGEDSEIFGLVGSALGLAAPVVTSGIGAAIHGVSNILKGRRGRGRRRYRNLKSRRYTTGGPRVARNIAMARRSNLLGKIRTRSGRSVTFKLPSNVATKKDVGTLKRGISVNAKAIRSNTKGVKANAKSIISTSNQLSSIDKKHTTASRSQNRILNSLNRKVRKVRSELDKAQEQQRMMQMFQFMMPPEIEKISFENAPTVGDNDVKDVEFKTNLLPLMMSMGNGGSGGMGDMMNNPMMMMFMMNAFNDND